MLKTSRLQASWFAPVFAALLAAGCSTAFLSSRQAQTKRTIDQAGRLAARGDYRAAALEYEQAVGAPAPNPWRDKALFELGSLRAAADNPDRDFAQALAAFRRLRDEHPKSRFNAQGRVWLGLLEKLVSLETDLAAGRAELAESRRLFELETARLEAEGREREAARSAATGLQARKLRELEGLVETQKAALESLRRQLDRMKEIDIQAEKKAKGMD